MTRPTSSLGQSGAALRALFTERIGLKLASLVVAVLLWLVVRARQPTEGYVDVMVVPALDSSLVLLGDPPRVRALVAGRTADLIRLHELPPVVQRVLADGVSGAYVIELSPDDVHIPAEMSDALHVLDVQPRRVVLRVAFRNSLPANVP